MNKLTHWLVFSRSTRWYCQMMRKPFQHVDVMSYDGEYFYYHHLGYANNNTMRVGKNWLEIRKILKNKIIVKVTVLDNGKDFKLPRFRLMTCVGLAKYFCRLNVKSLTPYALYSFLMKLRLDYEKQLNHGIDSITIV